MGRPVADRAGGRWRKARPAVNNGDCFYGLEPRSSLFRTYVILPASQRLTSPSGRSPSSRSVRHSVPQWCNICTTSGPQLPEALPRCPGPDAAHIPTQRSAQSGGREYYLFTAARHGCLSCVRELVEVEHINVFATSHSCNYTALDFAEWEVSQNTHLAPYCAHVVAYLRRRMHAVPGPPPPPLVGSVALDPLALEDQP